MFDFLKKGHEPKVEFISIVEGLDEIEEIRPRPAVEFLPQWWKSLPKYSDPANKLNSVTAKACPAFPHYFASGWIIPMWQDTTFIYDKTTDMWSVKGGRVSVMDWEIHSNSQFLDHVDVMFRGQKPSMIFKANSPWIAFTPKGWSLMQLPLFYNFNNDYTILPGIVDTDIHHQLNQQVAYFGDGHEITIKRGEPFVQYVPIKRDALKLEVRSATQQDLKRNHVSGLHLLTKFTGAGEYKRMRADSKQ